MKNNNLAKNNSSLTGFQKYKNYIVLVLVLIFLAVVGYIIYLKWYSEEDSVIPVVKASPSPSRNVLNTNSNSNVNSNLNNNSRNTHISNLNTTGPNTLNSNNLYNDIPDDPGHVNLLDNIRNNTVESNLNNKQVFNISNNVFTYDDAKAMCGAHGAKLATYEQVLEAYKKGAEWCNYGWSDGQMALYPTQKDTWTSLQSDPESAGMCGEWGVNGGYFENPNTLFGANCYGIKPEPKDNEKEKVMAISNKQKVMLDKINMYKSQLNEMRVMPFNKDLWSEKGKRN
tara:strand:- start:18 stop:869 length:852 start_codon:yes stop_codon:yes gene_type:complete